MVMPFVQRLALNTNITKNFRQFSTTALKKKPGATAKAVVSPNKNTNKTNTNGSPFKVLVGVSAGILVVCGLDVVAPTNDIRETTYWSDKDKISDRQTSSSAKDNTKKKLEPTKRSSLAASETPHQCQVVIVGAGMAGLHTALALTERHPHEQKKEGFFRKRRNTSKSNNIMILDVGRVGEGASGKAKGLVVPGIQVPEEDLAVAGGKDIAENVYKLTYKALHRLKHDIVNKYKIDCDWVDAGVVEASIHEGDEEEEDDDEDDGCVALTASEVRTVLGQPQSSSLYKCGEFDPSCSGVDPLALTRGLADILEGLGVRICEKTKAAKIEVLSANKGAEDMHTKSDAEVTEAYPYVVTTESGAQIQCQHVVLCTGPELVSQKLSQQLSNAIVPIYTWMASTAPLGDQCPLQGDNRPEDNNTKRKPAPMGGDDYVSLNYWRRTDDGRLLFGSLADSYPMPRWLAEYRLRRALREVYPQLDNIEFDHVWGGKLAFSMDSCPLIGRDSFYDTNVTGMDPSKGGVWYATGFGGHGIVPTVMAGSIIADGILGLDDETWRLFQRQFPPKYNYWPVSRLGAEAVLTIYNIFDWLHVSGVPVPRLPKPW